MDAVELPLPVDVAAAPKLMGSEEFPRPSAVVKEVEPRNDRVSLIVTHSNSIDRCTENEAQLCKNYSQLPRLKGEELSKNFSAGNGKNCLVITSTQEGVSLQRKAAKSNKSNSSCSKRTRMSQTEDCLKPNGIEESRDISDKLGSHHLKCSSPEKSQLPKQKSSASKRGGDKRNFKVPSAKAKFESSSMKIGASIFGSACAGNNFFGLYGLKHDFHDVTKLMDEPPLDELLKGTFVRRILSKDKVKKASNVNENFMNSVRKVCSILQSKKSVQSQNMVEMDCSSNKMSPCQLSSVCAVENVGEKDQSCTTDMPSCPKDSCSETESTASPLDFPLCHPKDVLERIALHPFQDLESLLLDVSKLAITTKSSNDLRSGKQASRRPSLPSFPWSHAFGGHSRTNYDTVKLSTSRSTCQGKWARMGVIGSSTDIDRRSYTNLDSFSYDQSLVPSTGSSDNKLMTSLCTSIPSGQWDSSSPVTCKDYQVNAEFGGQVDTKENGERCPRVLVAAQTLCELATRSLRQNPDGILRWQRKTSHQAMKTCNFKSNDKLEEMPSSSRSISVVGSVLVSRNVGQTMPSKKPRLSIVENKSSSHSNSVKKGPIAWSTSKSSRSIPSKPVRDSIMEGKRTTTSIKQHCMMPPPARDLDKAYEGQQQVGKLVLTDWKRGRDK